MQIGLRGHPRSLDWLQPSYDYGYNVVIMAKYRRRGAADVVAQIREMLDGRPVYVTFDLDSLDPATAPAVSYIEAGEKGFDIDEAVELVRAVRGMSPQRPSGCLGQDVIVARSQSPPVTWSSPVEDVAKGACKPATARTGGYRGGPFTPFDVERGPGSLADRTALGICACPDGDAVPLSTGVPPIRRRSRPGRQARGSQNGSNANSVGHRVAHGDGAARVGHDGETLAERADQPGRGRMLTKTRGGGEPSAVLENGEEVGHGTVRRARLGEVPKSSFCQLFIW